MKIKKVTNFLTISLLTAVTVVSLSVMGCKEQVKTDPKNPYGLDIINSLEAYSKTVEADSSNLLVDLEKHIPGVVLDIRYATENNFTGKKIYTAPKAWLRRAAADSLLKMQLTLPSLTLQQGKSLQCQLHLMSFPKRHPITIKSFRPRCWQTGINFSK
jgi:hypothetical protein